MVKKLGPVARKVVEKMRRKPKAQNGLAKLITGPAPAPEAPNKAADAQMAMGRPSTYDPTYTAMVEELCARGATDQELAEFFDVTVRTINRWKILHDEFGRALRRGKDVTDDRMEMSLYHKGMGFEVEKQIPIKLKRVTYEDGKKATEEEYVQMTTVKEFQPGDTTAMIFWLKNRRGDRWRDVHKVEHGKAGEFDNMSLEDLRAEIAREAQALRTLDPIVEEAQLLPPPAKKGKR